MRYNKPEKRLMRRIFLSLNFLPNLPAPITLPTSASIFTPRQVVKIIIRWFNEYTEASDAAISTQNEITAGLSVLIINPDEKIAK